jgi:hypothetical protein
VKEDSPLPDSSTHSGLQPGLLVRQVHHKVRGYNPNNW